MESTEILHKPSASPSAGVPRGLHLRSPGAAGCRGGCWLRCHTHSSQVLGKTVGTAFIYPEVTGAQYHNRFSFSSLVYLKDRLFEGIFFLLLPLTTALH